MKKRLARWALAHTVACVALFSILASSTLAQKANNEDSKNAGRNDSRSFVYVIANPEGSNAIEAFSRNRQNGHLTYVARYPTGGMGDPSVGGFEQHALVTNGRNLYAVNPGSDDISAFRIANNGLLTLLGRVPSSGRRPVSLALHGDLLYVANEGNTVIAAPEEQLPGSYSGFRVKNNGTLVPIPNSTIALKSGDSPADILFNHDGSQLIASRLGGNTIDSFLVGPDGRLIRGGLLNGQPGPFGLIFSPTRERNFFAGLANPAAGAPAPGVASYRIGQNGGLSQLDVVTDLPSEDPCWLAITSDGRRLFVSSFIPRTLTLYSVSNNGSLRLLSVREPDDDESLGSTDIALDASETYLYQLRAFDVPDGAVARVPKIKVFRLTGRNRNGGLELVQSVDMAEDLKDSGVMGLVIVDR